MNPFSVTSLSYTRLAVWRCLRGMNRSACNHSSITGVNPSSFLGRVVDGLGLGEQSSIKAYFLTVSLDTFKSRAMARHGVPCWSRSLIRC